MGDTIWGTLPDVTLDLKGFQTCTVSKMRLTFKSHRASIRCTYVGKSWTRPTAHHCCRCGGAHALDACCFKVVLTDVGLQFHY